MKLIGKITGAAAAFGFGLAALSGSATAGEHVNTPGSYVYVGNYIAGNNPSPGAVQVTQGQHEFRVRINSDGQAKVWTAAVNGGGTRGHYIDCDAGAGETYATIQVRMTGNGAFVNCEA